MDENVEDLTTDSNSNEDLNEHVYDDNSDGDSVDNEISDGIDDDHDEAEELFDSNEHDTNRNFTPTEIALVLSLLKSRHSLTNTCITNIC